MHAGVIRMIAIGIGVAWLGATPPSNRQPRFGPSVSLDTTLAPAMIALGDSVFHGKAGGGICFTCHGPTAKGVRGLGPDLTDAKWLHGDGSYAFIVSTVEKGIPKPKEAVAPMLPKGGAQLSAHQIQAVAAYVYSLSHKQATGSARYP